MCLLTHGFHKVIESYQSGDAGLAGAEGTIIVLRLAGEVCVEGTGIVVLRWTSLA